MHINKQPRKRLGGFSLIELLSVVAILSLLATAVVPAVSDIMASSRRTQYLTDLSSLLESARQYAVSKNTYVWVAFNDPSDGKTPLCARMVASRDGLSQGYGEDGWSKSSFDVPSANYATVSRLVTLGDFTLTADPDSDLAKTPTFNITGGRQTPSLTRCIQFTPSGEAKIDSGIQGNITLKTKASYGKMAKVEDTVVINGATGFVKIQEGRAN